MQKIMIIEDTPAIREELALLLENEGYTPLMVTEFTDVPSLNRTPSRGQRKNIKIFHSAAGMPRCGNRRFG